MTDTAKNVLEKLREQIKNPRQQLLITQNPMAVVSPAMFKEMLDMGIIDESGRVI